MDLNRSRYNITVRLFKIIKDLSHEKQFILYKQLVKDNIRAELFKLIIDMPEDQKHQLLEQIGENSLADEPLRTVNLDDHESFMRENPRKICLIAVKCQIGEHTFKSHIIDISRVGAFIESNEPLAVGQKIAMAFKLPNHHEAILVNGQITRSAARGIGTKFYNLSPPQEDMILKFIEDKK